VAYKPGEEFQFGNLADYVSLAPTTGKPEKQWASPDDYQVDLSKLAERIGQQAAKIAAVEYCVSPDLQLAPSLSDMDLADVEKKNLDFDGYSA